jgi:type I restriction enzyme S subunit
LQHLEHFREIAASKVTTMGHIQRHHLHDATVVVPTSEALQGLGELMQPLHERVIQSRLQMRTLAELRDTLLPRLISGKLRVPEAEKLVEAML